MPSVAIVGASPKAERISNQVIVRYLARGYTVFPVHPAGRPVHDLQTLRSLAELPEQPDIISMYVNPRTGLDMLTEIVAVARCTGAEATVLWLNPGAESDELATAACGHGLRVIRACNMVALGYGDPLEVLDSMDHTRRQSP